MTVLIIFQVLIFPVFAGDSKSELNNFYRLEQQRWQNAFIDVNDKSGFDILFYHLDIRLEIDSPYIEGSVLCRFTATIDSLEILKLNLHHSLSIDRIEGPVRRHSFANDTIYIHLKQSHKKFQTGEIKIFYAGKPERAGGIKGLAYETHGKNEPIIATLSTPFLSFYWWPCKDGPGDKADSVYIDITIPQKTAERREYIAVSNGVLEKTESGEGKKTFFWRERYPIVPYYVMLAVSNYTHFQQSINGPVEFPIDYYVFNENLNSSRDIMADFPQVMDFFIHTLGHYPFSEEKYAMTEIGFYNAIENQTNTVMNNLSELYFDVAVHELAHMWYGDMITCESWHHAWLNEGFAVYCEALWHEFKYGKEAYLKKMRENEYLKGGTLFLQEVTDPFQIFIGIIYSKGSWFLHMLRGVLGDASFFKCLKAYTGYEKIRYSHATSDDFLSVCENVSGIDLDFFFQQWLYDEYYPQYFYTFSQDPQDKKISLNIRQTQGKLGRRPVFIMPVQVLLQFQDGTDSLVTVWNDRQEQTFLISAEKQITRILIDPNEWILKTVSRDIDINMDDYHFSLLQNFPNPFSSRTVLQYIVSQKDYVRLFIYDVRGRLVAKVVDKVQPPGSYQCTWDGYDQTGRRVSSGVYFAVLDQDMMIKIIRL
ncbi:hypothetical protein JW935_10995 [candidate division KSB1 bacterium]|nr:hypothetical protein [candidate division KSB1 bacterium]